MNKAKQLVLALLVGFKPDHDLVKNALEDADLGRDLVAGQKITKDDLFDKTSAGKSILTYKECWDKIGDVMAVISANGESLTFEDMQRDLGDGKTIVKMAEEHGALEVAFSPVLWKDNMAAMDDAWFSITKFRRDKHDYRLIRRAVAEAGGETIREDVLDDMDISPDRMRSAIMTGEMKDVLEILAAHGDHLRKADVLMRDSSNETALDKAGSWEHVDAWYPELLKNGEGFTHEDWTAKCADGKTPLARAIEHKALGKLFSAPVWRHDPDGMVKLLREVPEDKMSEISVQTVMAEIVELNYGENCCTDSHFTRDRLLQKIRGPLENDDQGRAVTILPLGLKKIWDSINKVQDDLSRNEQRITLDDLRQVSGYAHETCLLQAARYGHFDKVVDIVKTTGETLTLDDLTAAGQSGKSILDILAEGKSVSVVMDPALWVGRVQDMVELWGKVPEAAREGIDFESLHGDVNIMTLRQARANRSGPAFRLQL